MKVSLIMTVFNAEKFLPKILKNVFKQKFLDFELVAINDGSTDDSLNILKQFSAVEPRLKVITQCNKGIGPARQNGIDNSVGEYIGFIDCDDEISDLLLEDNYNLINKYFGDIILFGYSRYFPERKKSIKESPAEEILFFKSNEEFGRNFLSLNRGSDLGFAWNKLIRRSFLVDNNLSFSNAKTDDDAIFMYKVFQKVQRVIVNPKIYYRYYMRKSSLSHHITDLNSFEKNIRIRRITALKMFDKWGLKYNYVTGHNDIRLIDVKFRQVFFENKATMNIIRLSHHLMKSEEIKTIRQVLKKNFFRLNLKDRLYFIAVQMRMYFVLYLYDK
ncbi:glycosyltransferase family 2 protein [Lactiplantibacillus plantarum]|uniref:glycosyltransferase family 2 protein n=1 Tax=Lactiplantibacillus plantarum TaxID=1590 RepID=UPI001D089771|nr:glycosyltransferase family 2 protein [Lactiplantibacillus plantarum]MCB7178145.1 glycosyltransferase [Lactiplantibacillus plantarum]